MKRKTVNLKDMTPEQRKEYKKKWAKEYYRKNKAKLNKKSKEYYRKNREEIRTKARESYIKNKDKRAKEMAKYKKDNREKWNEYQRNYKREKYAEMSLEEKRKYLKKKAEYPIYSYTLRKNMMNKIDNFVNKVIEEMSDSNLLFESDRIKNETFNLRIKVKNSSKSYSYTKRKKILNRIWEVAKIEVINGYTDKIELNMAKDQGDITINLGIKK